MKYLNFSNVEQLIFHDEVLQQKLSKHLYGFFEQWRLGIRVPSLKQLAKSAVLDVLSYLDDSDIRILEEYFGEKIVIEKLNYSIVENLKIPLTEVGTCEQLSRVIGFNNLSIWRDEESLYLSFWR